MIKTVREFTPEEIAAYDASKLVQELQKKEAFDAGYKIRCDGVVGHRSYPDGSKK